jgi:hypothetical protein
MPCPLEYIDVPQTLFELVLMTNSVQNHIIDVPFPI